MGGWIGPRIRFKCLLCGECCRFYWVPLTHVDVRRIVERTGLRPLQFAGEVPKPKVGDWGIPAFLLSDGVEHYLVLKKRVDGFCIFIKREGLSFACSIYDSRPTTCVFYPFVYARDGGVVRFEVVEAARDFCPGLGRGRAKGFDAEFAAALAHDEALAQYRELVNRWNRLVAAGAVEATLEGFLGYITNF